MLFQAVGVPSVQNRLKNYFFLFIVFIGIIFFDFKFCVVLFESFRILGNRGVTFFVSFVFFVTGSVCEFGHVTFFVRNLAWFNNMSIDLDGRYFYGLIGGFNILRSLWGQDFDQCLF